MGIAARYFIDEISASTASTLLGLSLRTVERYCARGFFLTAYQPGNGATAHWRLSRREVLSRIPQSTDPAVSPTER